MNLWNEFKTNQHKIIHKWSHYFPVYDKLLSENLDDARDRLNVRKHRFFVDRSPELLKL